jgi:hypothetical protein
MWSRRVSSSCFYLATRRVTHIDKSGKSFVCDRGQQNLRKRVKIHCPVRTFDIISECEFTKCICHCN